MFLLTLRDLQFRAVRFGIAIIGTALVFAMVLLMSGLSNQFKNEPHITVDAVGADHWIVADSATGAFTAAPPIEESSVEDLRNGGTTAEPIVITRSVTSSGSKSEDKKDVWVMGYSVGQDLGAPKVNDGDEVSGRGELVASKEAGLKIGDTTEIGGTKFDVKGITEATITGGTPILFMDVKDAQQLAYRGAPQVTAIVVKGDVKSLPAGLKSMTPDDTAEDALRPLKKPVGAIDVVQILLWLVAATIIGAVVYLSALERRRDFAVLKAVGASSRGLLGGLATQSVIIALVAAVVATLISAALVPLFPIPVQVPVRAYIQLPILALLAGALASLGGLRKAVGVEPALAFQGPGA